MTTRARGCDISADEIFVSDGAKCDSGNIQEIFSVDNKIAVCDPVYPVYVDTNVMAGRTGTYNPTDRNMERCNLHAMYSRERFCTRLPKRRHRTSFICASQIIQQDRQSQKHSFRNGLIMQTKSVQLSSMMLLMKHIFHEDDVPHTIYECEGARTCAIELRSFSKECRIHRNKTWISPLSLKT